MHDASVFERPSVMPAKHSVEELVVAPNTLGAPEPATPRQRRLRLLVLGVGNVLRSDDGIGVHAARMLRERCRAPIVIADVGTAILRALPLIAWADRVLAIDAMQAGGVAGAIYVGNLAALFPTAALPSSAHALDLRAALELLPAAKVRPEIYVLGVEPASLALGLDLSPRLRRVLPSVVERAEGTLRDWRRGVLGAIGAVPSG